MSKNTSISIGAHFEQFIQSQIASGEYASVSEVIRDALRAMELRRQKIDALRDALRQGEESGYANNFNPQEFLTRMKSKRNRA